jgi:hypothetical protein
MTKLKVAKAKFLTDIDYQAVIPEVVSSLGISYIDYSLMIGKGKQWLTKKISHQDSAPLSRMDFKRLRLFFDEHFPKTDFEEFVWSVVVEKSYQGKTKYALVKIIDEKEQEIANLKEKLNNQYSEEVENE